MKARKSLLRPGSEIVLTMTVAECRILRRILNRVAESHKVMREDERAAEDFARAIFWGLVE